MINWKNINTEDLMLSVDIAKRYIKMFPEAKVSIMDLQMDISACHISCPLKLKELLVADDFNFVHDVVGITRHIDRESGELLDCFLPRYAR